MNPKIKINDKNYQIYTQPDLLLNRELFRQREENFISYDDPKNLLNDQYDSLYTNITNHITLSGNLRTIALKNDTFAISDIKMKIPLTLSEEIHLTEVDDSKYKGYFRELRFMDMGDFFIYKNIPNPLYFINFKEGNRKPLMIEFQLPNHTICGEVFRSKINLFCSYRSKSHYMIAV